MFKIVNNERLSDNMFRVTFEAPLVARKAQPGQFLMFRVDEFGERMPITISSYDREAGTVSVIMQRVGSTTALLAGKKAGLDDGVDLGLPALDGDVCVVHALALADRDPQ